MTKEQFIKDAKKLGFKRYQDLVVKLGYNERSLSRYKAGDNLTEKFVKAFEAYRNDAKPVKKADIGDIKVEAMPAKKAQKKAQKVEVEVEEKAQNDDGIGIDISNEDYHKSTNMSVSKLKVIIENAKEFESRYIKKDFEQKETDALILGRLHHTLVLEPHKLDEDYIILDMPARPVKDDWIKAIETLGGNVRLTDNGKGTLIVKDTVEMLKEQCDGLKCKTHKTICTKAHYELAQQTAQKALDSWFELIVGQKTLLKAQLRDLLQYEKCYVEKTFYGEMNGVKVQIRPDILINLGKQFDVWFVIDLKTMETATPKEFAQQGGRFFWDMQEQFYCEVLKQNGITPKAFYFNCAGKKEFSGAGFYDWGESTKIEAQKVLKAGLNKYKYCTQNDVFLEAKFDYVNLKFEAVTTLDVPVYRQYTLGDLGV